MANYNSAFSGSQIDEAIGFAQNAVRFNAAQNLTDAQKTQARENIGLTWPCNPNLLDNWYFGDPVNTQGKTQYSSIGYTVDRWRMLFTTGSLAIVDNGIQFKGTGGQTNRLIQYFQHPLAAGRTYTLSCLLGNITGAKTSINFYYNESAPVLIGACNADNLTKITFTAASGITNIFCQQPSETDYTIVAVKLELGDQQTLAHQDADGNWVLNEIPNKAEQLAICSQYAPDTGELLGGWEHPPMQLGVEYRTTERYLGKPVYAQLVDCGTVPSVGSYKTVEISGAEIRFVEAWAPMRGRTLPFYNANGIELVVYAGHGYVRIWNYSHNDATTNIYATVKYTKKTD